eukprot:6210316-Pleurochrysis_carterae.AAC.1
MLFFDHALALPHIPHCFSELHSPILGAKFHLPSPLPSLLENREQVFKLAHKTLLLDPSGRTVYMGATLSVVVHFERLGFIFDVRENTADQLLDAIAGAGNRAIHAVTAASECGSTDALTHIRMHARGVV